MQTSRDQSHGDLKCDRGPIRAVLFDLGGTLFSYRGMALEFPKLAKRAAERLRLDVGFSRASLTYLRSWREAWESVRSKPFYLHRDVYEDSVVRFARRLGREPSREFVEWAHRELCRLLIETADLRFGCRRTLAELRSRGCHVGIVSNGDASDLEDLLTYTGLRKEVDAWTSSEEAGSCKPDAEIYRQALGKAGLEPKDTLFVGDTLHLDILGAQRLGMATAWARVRTVRIVESWMRLRDADAARPDYVVRRLPEVVPIVAGRGNQREAAPMISGGARR